MSRYTGEEHMIRAGVIYKGNDHTVHSPLKTGG